MRTRNVVRTAAVVSLLALGAGAQASIVVETVIVGNPGNAADTRYDPTGFGGVDYTYNMGKHEVTAGQYTEFLNAVADDDTYELYSTNMDTAVHPFGCNIVRGGSPGSYIYSVAPDWADRPVNWVSWGDAARFSNWLHNGQPTGAQGLSTTEDGSYFLDGAMSGAELLAITREPDATWMIPSEDEWYKAAYHKNDGVTGNYFDYPTISNSVPSNILNGGGNNATFYDDDYTVGNPYYRTESGAHVNSESPYGTFDQGGNVWEWNEALIDASRGLRGGAFSGFGIRLHVSNRYTSPPSADGHSIGFRVAQVPGPICATLGDVDGSGTVDGNDIAGFLRVKLGNPDPGDNEACADYGTGNLAGDVAAFVGDLLN